MSDADKSPHSHPPEDRTRIARSTASATASPDQVPEDRTRIATPTTSDDGTRLSDAPDPPMPAPSADVQLVAPGVLINDNYRILKLVSAGGMGEVYRAENIFTGDPVAVKIILPNLARDESIIDLFRREARILVQMRDDAIVRYHNFVRDKGLNRYCLIMEFVEGRHLWDHIQDVAPLDADQALVLLRRLARGLAQAHARGVTHRDLSPDNVILRDNRVDEAVLIDFGIARSTELGDGLNGRFAGKFKYIAPEQLGHSGGEIAPPADVYGLALMIAAAMRGSPLEMGSSVVEASEARQRIPDLSGISHRLYPLLQHMLEPDPRARPHDMDAVLRILDAPSHLPARYRLPLWNMDAPTAGAGTGRIDASDPSMAPDERTPTDALTESASPFGAAIPVPQSGSSLASAPARKSRLPAYAAIGVLALAGAGWFIFGQGAAPPAPENPPATQADPRITTLDALPARDPETRGGFLASQPLPDCTLAMRFASGPNAGKIGTLADGPRDFGPLQSAYAAAFASRPALVSTEVRTAQCPALDFAAALIGRAAEPPVLSLDNALTTSGGNVSGRIRDLRGRSLWLFVVSPKGAIYDLSSTAQPQADGSFTFDFGISLAADELGPQPQLIVALASATPLATVAAAPSGTGADLLLPLVLDEIASNGIEVALDIAMLTVNPPEAPAPDTDAPQPEDEPTPPVLPE